AWPAGHHRRHQRWEVFAARERICVRRWNRSGGRCREEGARQLAILVKARERVRRGSVRFSEEFAENSGILEPLPEAKIWFTIPRCKTVLGCYSFPRYG